MPRLGLAVLIPALAPGDAGGRWERPCPHGQRGLGFLPFLETAAPAAPLREEPWEGMGL